MQTPTVAGRRLGGTRPRNPAVGARGRAGPDRRGAARRGGRRGRDRGGRGSAGDRQELADGRGRGAGAGRRDGAAARARRGDGARVRPRHRDPAAGAVHRAAGRRDRERAFAGAAGLARPLFEEVPDRAAADDRLFARFHGLHWLCARLAEERPLAMLIDDAHWADEQSIRFLAYLAARIEEIPACAILAVRTGEAASAPDALTELLEREPPPTVRPPPLSPAAVAELVRGSLGGETGDAVCAECARTTAGNPLLVRQLIAALEERGGEPARLDARRDRGHRAAVGGPLRGRPARSPLADGRGRGAGAGDRRRRRLPGRDGGGRGRGPRWRRRRGRRADRRRALHPRSAAEVRAPDHPAGLARLDPAGRADAAPSRRGSRAGARPGAAGARGRPSPGRRPRRPRRRALGVRRAHGGGAPGRRPRRRPSRRCGSCAGRSRRTRRPRCGARSCSSSARPSRPPACPRRPGGWSRRCACRAVRRSARTRRSASRMVRFLAAELPEAVAACEDMLATAGGLDRELRLGLEFQAAATRMVGGLPSAETFGRMLALEHEVSRGETAAERSLLALIALVFAATTARTGRRGRGAGRGGLGRRAAPGRGPLAAPHAGGSRDDDRADGRLDRHRALGQAEQGDRACGAPASRRGGRGARCSSTPARSACARPARSGPAISAARRPTPSRRWRCSPPTIRSSARPRSPRSSTSTSSAARSSRPRRSCATPGRPVSCRCR